MGVEEVSIYTTGYIGPTQPWLDSVGNTRSVLEPEFRKWLRLSIQSSPTAKTRDNDIRKLNEFDRNWP